MDFSQFSTTDISIFSIFLISWLLQIYFIFKRVYPLAFFKKAPITDKPYLPLVSVVICAKNEADNLEKFLPSVLTQDYPDYQVVVVNDTSGDDTEMVLARLKQNHPRLYYTTIPADKRFQHGKKLALTIGIKAASHDYIVFTDADCEPSSNQWLKNMMQGFASHEKELVLGFGGYQKRKGLLNFLIRYDTFYTAIQYLGFALSKKPYMGVGRNLAYRKKLFINNNGFTNHMNLLSGDDDLFVQENANADNTSVVIDAESQTLSVPQTKLRNWRLQKARHLTTSSLYKTGVKLELFLDPLGREIMWILGIFLIIFNTFALAVIGIIILTLLVKLLFFHKAAKKLNLGRIYWGVLIFDFLHPWLLIWAQTGNFSGSNKKKWK